MELLNLDLLVHHYLIKNHRIIGQLYGGAAACAGTVNNNLYDYYGRMGVSWNNGLDSYLSPSACGSVFSPMMDGI